MKMETKIEHWVCIKEPRPAFLKQWSQITFPTKGKVYTMREMFLGPNSSNEIVMNCRLNELVNQPVLLSMTEDFGEPYFMISYFRKLDKLKFDVSKEVTRELEDV